MLFTKPSPLSFKVVGLRFPKYDLNKGGTSDLAKQGGEEPVRLLPLPYTKSYRSQREAGSGRGDLRRGRAHQLVVLCQWVRSANIQTGNIRTELVIFRNTYVYINTYMHVIII